MKTGTGSSHGDPVPVFSSRMILAVVKAAALQFFGAVLPVIMAGLGMAVILVVFPPLTFQPILIVLSSRMIAIPVVPLAILAIPVVPMLAVATGLFPLRAALLADHAFLFLAHFPFVGSDPRRGASFRAAQAGAVAASVPGGRPCRPQEGSPIRRSGPGRKRPPCTAENDGEWMHRRCSGPGRPAAFRHKGM